MYGTRIERVSKSLINGGKSCRKIRCTTTGKEFNSIKEAAVFYGIKTPGNISNSAKNANRHCGKLPDGTLLKWEYID